MAALFMTANLKNIPRLLRFGLDPITPSVCRGIGSVVVLSHRLSKPVVNIESSIN